MSAASNGAVNTRSIFSRTFSSSQSIPLIIAGKDIHTEQTFDVISPLGNEIAWSTSSAGLKDVEAAVASAQEAFPAWSRTKPSVRRDILWKAAELVAQRRQELAEYMHVEIGATKQFQDFILDMSIEGIKDTAGKIADAVTGRVPVSEIPDTRAIIHRRPFGVNLAIAPWNAPYHLGFRSVLFPLATGNTVIMKGSELSPMCHWAIADIFRQAGLPAGCLNLLFHSPKDGPMITDSLIAHPSVRKINFTGSTRVGRIIASKAGQYLKPVLMELGGKSNAIVLADADLQTAATHCALGAFFNAGQICMSTERIFVHSSAAAEFIDRFQAMSRTVFGSEPSVLITTAAANRTKQLVEDAVAKGARPVEISEPGVPAGTEIPQTMWPVILSGVTKDMNIYKEESFGPSVSIYTFDDEDEVIRLANDTDYGLSASIYSRDLNRAFRIAECIESGAVHINSMTVHDEYPLPHGGVKNSGFGRFNGTEGLEEFLYSKTVTWIEAQQKLT